MEPTDLNFKIRPSACGNIMGQKGLGKTGESYLIQWVKEKLYNRRPDIKGKYLDKGNETEEDGFTLLCTELNLGMVYKNEQLFENAFMIGTPDLIVNGTVYDNKSSWSLDTFPLFDKECPNKDYYYQLQCYMELTGCDKSVLAYTLLDAPEFIIEREVKWITDPDKIYRKINELVFTQDHFDAMCDIYCPAAKSDYFVPIPDEKRIKTFEIKKDPTVIELINSRVKESREFIKQLF